MFETDIVLSKHSLQYLRRREVEGVEFTRITVKKEESTPILEKNDLTLKCK